MISSPVTILPQVSDKYATKLTKLGIFTVLDLLTYFPRYHKDSSEILLFSETELDSEVTVAAEVETITSTRIRGGRTLQKAKLLDEQGTIMPATWFNQPYLVKALSSAPRYLFSGKVKDYRGNLTFFPNTYEPIIGGREQVHLGRIAPQYSLTAGVSPKWLRNRIKFLLDNLDLAEELNAQLAEIAHYFEMTSEQLLAAIKDIHFPESETDFDTAKHVLSLVELTNLQLKLVAKFSSQKAFHAPRLEFDQQRIGEFVKQLPFELTTDQQTTVAHVLTELRGEQPMYRLVQGDVGTGKTIVAVIASLAAAMSGLQTIVLAPTTVLAKQHAETFSEFLKEKDIKTLLVTGNTQTQTELADVLIGTSAILARQASLVKNPGLIIVDEQHKFGVGQREELLKPFNFPEKKFPHFLDMTATPIPRTMAMALFGDVEVSTIKSKPAGRLAIKTFLTPESKRESSYDWIRTQVQDKGEQVYWISPIIDESETVAANSAKKLYKHLSEEVFPDFKVGLLHGRIKPDEKTRVMQDFAEGKIQILVSTSVIEVGIDVPNATVMMIEGAERFGLAQLHQIRGRVGRSDKQSWCFLFPTIKATDEAVERLKFFSEHTDGLEISEYDLQRRGPGEVFGAKQSGVPNLKVASLTDLAQLKQSREIAEKLYQDGIKSIPLFN